MGALSKKVLIKYQVDTRQAKRGLDQMAKGAEKVERSAKESAAALRRFDKAASSARRNSAMVAKTLRDASQASGGLGSSMSALAGSMGGPAGIIAAATGGAFALSQLSSAATDLADRSLAVQAVFQNVPLSIEGARRSTRGLVADFDLARLAADSVSLGVTDSAQKFAELTSALQKLGAKRGIDSLKSIQDGLSGIGRRETELLDNLGIVLKVSEAEQEYAASLGKTTKELTTAEKAEAFRVTATRKVIDAAKGVTLTTDGAAAAVRRFNVELQNIEDRALGGEVATTSLADGLAQIAKDGPINIKALKDYGSEAAELKVTLRDLGVAGADIPRTIDELTKAAKAANISMSRLKGLEDLRRQAQANDPAFKQEQARLAAEQESLATAKLRIAEIENEQAFLSHNNDAIAQKAELQIESLKLQARIVRATGDEARARQIERQAELAQYAELSRLANLRKGGGRRRKRDPYAAERLEFQQQLTEAINAERKREFSEAASLQRGYLQDVRAFELELAAAKQPNIDRAQAEQERRRVLAEFEQNEAARKLERDLLLATSEDQRSLLRQQAFAEREAALTREIELEANVDEKARLRDEREQIRHEAAMVRIEDELRAREESAARIGKAISSVSEVEQAGLQLSQSVAGASIKNAERQRAAMAGIEAGHLAFKGGVSIAEGFINIAAGNYPKGVAQILAGGAAVVKAGTLAASVGARVRGGGGGGGASPTAGTATQFSRGESVQSASQSVDRGAPISVRDEVEGNANNTSSSAARSKSGTVINIGTINSTGQIDDTTAKKIKQKLGDLQTLDGRV